MALPVLERTWQYNVNQTLPAGATVTENYQKLLLALKNSLIGFATLPWTVVGSSNGVTAGLDAVDRWVTYTNLVYGNNAAAHSWIVLKQTGLASNFQLLITYNGTAGTAGATWGTYVSPAAGFTGGSVTVNPTATDILTMQVIGSPITNNNTTTPFQTELHVQQATNGEGTRIFACIAGQNCLFGVFEKVADPTPGWTAPQVVCQMFGGLSNADRATYAIFNDAASLACLLNGTAAPMYVTAEGTLAAMAGEYLTVANEVDSSYPMFPMGILNTAIVGRRGRHGRLRDMWWGQASAPPATSGTTYPLDGSKQFVQFGHMVFPWNGSIPLTT